MRDIIVWYWLLPANSPSFTCKSLQTNNKRLGRDFGLVTLTSERLVVPKDHHIVQWLTDDPEARIRFNPQTRIQLKPQLELPLIGGSNKKDRKP